MKKAEKRKVVLIGTGMVGMSYAYAILNQNLCDELVLIDINKKKAEGEAMDLNHGVAFSGGNMESYAGEYSDCRDADLIVLTAGLPQKERQSRLDLLNENRKFFDSILHIVQAFCLHPGERNLPGIFSAYLWRKHRFADCGTEFAVIWGEYAPQ